MWFRKPIRSPSWGFGREWEWLPTDAETGDYAASVLNSKREKSSTRHWPLQTTKHYQSRTRKSFSFLLPRRYASPTMLICTFDQNDIIIAVSFWKMIISGEVVREYSYRPSSDPSFYVVYGKTSQSADNFDLINAWIHYLRKYGNQPATFSDFRCWGKTGIRCGGISLTFQKITLDNTHHCFPGWRLQLKNVFRQIVLRMLTGLLCS